MIFKHKDDNASDIAQLQRLLAAPYLSDFQRKKIENEIRTMQAGDKNEKDAAYYIDFHLENSENWAVIHDLRLEHEGRTAQIDHLLINRFGEIYVCESKSFKYGVLVNEYGEFSRYNYHGKITGIESPIEQNNRHMALLQTMIDDGAVALPVRLGFIIKPRLISLILVGVNGRISRPKTSKYDKDLDRIIKADQIKTKILDDVDASTSLNVTNFARMITDMSKIIGKETLYAVGEELAKLHVPQRIDWEERFGINKPVATTNNASTSNTAPNPPVIKPTANENGKQTQRNFCCKCKKTVTPTVANYCWSNRERFGGKVYCYDCQKLKK